MAFTAQPQRHALSHTLSGSTASRVKTAPARRLRQRGNAVLFSLLAMVIGGVVVAVGINQYQDAERAATVQGTVAEINTIIGNAKQNFGQYSYSGVTTAIALSSRVIPANLQEGSGSTATARNKFGGGVTLLPATTNGNAVLTYAGVPSEVCASVVSGTHGLAQTVTVGSTVVKSAGTAIAVGAINTSCVGANGIVQIAWEFGRS